MKENASSGFCHDFNEAELLPWLDNHTHITWVMTLMIFETLIFAAFIVLRKPHDCFACLTKYEHSTFSMFQLTKEEQRRRVRFAKEGDMTLPPVIGVPSLIKTPNISPLTLKESQGNSTTRLSSMPESVKPGDHQVTYRNPNPFRQDKSEVS